MISVCLASFNGERYIREQVESILSSPEVGELIISDDGSSDRTLAIVNAIADPRVRVVAGPRKGLVRNFESLLEQVKGEYIFLSDQDDIWRPNKVRAIIGLLQGADLVVSDCEIVDSQGAVMEESFFSIRHSGPGFIKNLSRNSFLGCCMAFRRNVLDAAMPFPSRLPMHDWWLGLVATMVGQVIFVDERLVLYRRHGANASDAAGRSSASRGTQIRWRLLLSWLLLKRFLALKLCGRF